MIFVYLGHWVTEFVGSFAYAFHLQLFFLVAGFFAIRTSKRKVTEWFPKQVFSLLIPYFIWVMISFVFKNIDNANISIVDYLSIFTNPNEMQPNYWFFPAFIAVSTVYYLLYKVTNKPGMILVISIILHFLLGETSIIAVEFNVFRNVNNWPYILKIINGWFMISSIPHYLFWYSLGAILFNKVDLLLNTKVTKPMVFYIMGSISGLISIVLFFKKITEFNIFYDLIYKNNFIFEFYRVCCSIIIIVFVFFISKLMEESNTLNNIGKSSMNFMGLEYITHGYYALSFLPMINLGIPNIKSTVQVITITVIQIVINLWISNRINKYLPLLNGDWSKQKKC